MNDIFSFLQDNVLFSFDDAWEWIKSDDPPLITKTIIVALIAWGGAQVRGIVSFLFKEAQRNVISIVYFDNSNSMYDAFSEWYRENYPMSFRRVEAIMDANYDEGIRLFKLKFRQFSDINYIKYKGKYILVEKSKDRLEGARDYSSRFIESYTLRCLWGSDVLMELVDEVYTKWKSRKGGDTGLRAIVTDKWSNSKVIHVGTYKTLSQIFIEGKESLMEDINNFLGKKELYISHGIRFKRSYLLYGPPGTGKTSLVFGIAHWLKRPVYYLNPSEFSSDDAFESFVSEVSDKSIILIEDIDVFWTDRDSSGNTSVSFQSLLNVLDGLHSPNDVLIFMTTNCADRFDDALFRKGRMDYKMKIDHPDKNTVERYMSLFFNKPVLLPEEYKGILPMVDVQDACIKSSTPEEAIKRLTE